MLPGMRKRGNSTQLKEECQTEVVKKANRKLWYIYTMEYQSAIKKNTLESVLMWWMKLEPIIQSEARKKNTNTVY